MKKAVLVLLCMAMMAGCATTHMTKPEKAPELVTQPDKAQLVIIRETMFGGAIVFWNYLDGRLIGETMGQSYFITPVAPGPHHVVVASENTCAAQFDFKPGKTYFLGEGVAMGVWRARSSGFYPMTLEDATKAMNSCTYMAYDPNSGGEDMDPALYKKAVEEYEADVKANPDDFKDILKYDGVVLGQ
jgi:hypothetical protein